MADVCRQRMIKAEDECDRLRTELKELLQAAGVLSSKDDRVAIVSLESDVSVCVCVCVVVSFMFGDNVSINTTIE